MPSKLVMLCQAESMTARHKHREDLCMSSMQTHWEDWTLLKPFHGRAGMHAPAVPLHTIARMK